MGKRIASFSKGKRIIKSGKYEQRMYVILEGEVEISFTVNDEKVSVARLGKGDFFGEVSLFQEIERTANAYALTDVRATFIDSPEELVAFITKNPRYAVKMVRTLTERIANTDRLLVGELCGNRVVKYVW
ncbi:MAG TPA: cyclic nucleotide-binding domain-containing protein [Spirochaetota bacterium]|nr:cyclic nucleotide-binding domain-containing protein [Spirochaetota bacterium]HNT12795.1 cyclic nucleotide-binding domain-containing protein [Spirochaetota bacterium]HNV46011.1 cyclic nucleotide-binding domain-containing protein [Spirochaetota bacterium]HOS40700.1 cyclic nucleotide-binding domain-containing protein [Spirochaetota bacterium]HPI23056.1 cyclic nucleotide-binding domain-containing protein [Spirochaetota bacterium]